MKELKFNSILNDINNLLCDIKLFLFILLVLCVFRAAFLAVFNSSLSGVPARNIILAMFFGMRISLKTAGAFILPSFAVTIAAVIFSKLNTRKIKFYIGCFEISLLSLLFQARIPYYKEFANAFDAFIFNTFKDDVLAIADTAIKQYNAPLRIIFAAVIAAILCLIWCVFLRTEIIAPAFKNKYKKTILSVLICLFIISAPFVRHGGSFGYNGSIYWKNAARLNLHILNEAIVDDIQALYRARKLYKTLSAGNTANSEEIKKHAQILTGNPYDYNSIEPLLQRTAAGAKIKKPKHIFLIIAETYMLWPMLPQYSALGIADGLKNIASENNAVFIKSFLPAGNGTMFALTSTVLGLPEVGAYPGNRETTKSEYETSIAKIMKDLGYGVNFFYGGFSSWENIGAFMTNQGFQNSKYVYDFNSPSKNAWGAEDRYFFEGVKEMISDASPSFNVILTSSNHPPLTVDMDNEPDIKTKKQFKHIIDTDDDMLSKLQHFEYADKYMAKFIKDAYEKFPGSIFIVVGDHAQRWHINPQAGDYEKTAVPFVLYGYGISKKLVEASSAGSHTDLASVLTELIAPKGFKYYALGQDFLSRKNVAIHHVFWTDGKILYSTNDNSFELLEGADGGAPSQEYTQEINERVKALKAVASYRIIKGLELK
ncbi:MAG: sulfatase-like hydrolase/transferase [Elusimicrobiota bacterium]|jgi:phosphoglycerol transferase MdoB-like AlkP superfamily enzyme|nr:sulfatase-like hydrolase/transferase [Elusimicrobiota bacterium]